MQWILMLVGLALGWMVDEAVADALIGALLGLGIGQAFRLASLGRQAAEQLSQLQGAKTALANVEARVRQLEISGTRAPEEAPAASATVEPSPQMVEQAPAPAQAAEPIAQPVP
ncbi:hypothetical protein HX859_01950, partial [Pseudomonas gingeri]